MSRYERGGLRSRLAVFAALAGCGLASCLSEYDERYRFPAPGASAPAGAPENSVPRCTDGLDNDRDGFKDCDDSGCALLPACNGTVLENTLSLCLDRADNDADTAIDCADAGCRAFEHCLPELACADGKDNDLDGKLDCADTDCAPHPACQEQREDTRTLCGDGRDNDGDARVDCDDADCQAFSICAKPREDTDALCRDKEDNDGDGKADCEDADCRAFAFCQAPQENTLTLCTDKADNDGDKAVDCADTECAALVACAQGTSIKEVTQTAPDKPLAEAVAALRPGWKWFLGDAGNDSPIAGPRSTVGGSWGGIYVATGATGATRDTIDLSGFFLKKLRFGLRTTCREENLAVKTQWKSPNAADQAGTAYNATLPLASAKMSPGDRAGDGQWHDYAVDYTHLVVNKYNAARLVLPFSIWCVDQAAGVTLEVRDLRFEGESAVKCIEVVGDPRFGGTVYCDVR